MFPRRPLARMLSGAVGLALLSACAATRWQAEPSEHFDGRHFANDEPFEVGLRDLLRFYMTRERGEWRRDLDLEPGPPPPERVGGGELRATFVNHATMLVQADGLNLLTDPIWSRRASPVPFAGPLRYRPPGIDFDDLPPIDVVVISHNHYDHMDLPTLHRLHATHDPVFVVPAGDAAVLRRHGIARVVELDWWQGWTMPNGCMLHGVPVRHWSGRRVLPSDRNLSLWLGFVIETAGGPVYFAGDTGWGDHFRQTGERFGPHRLALLPIGAYLPRWLTAYQHIDPAEAVQAHRELGAAFSLGIHYGTFELADDGMDQPPRDLAEALAREGLSAEVFNAADFGKRYAVPPLSIPQTRNPTCAAIPS